MSSFLLKIGKRLKIWLNYILDRIVDLCQFCIFWSGLLPAFIQNGIKGVSYFVGNLALLLSDFPRMNAYQLKGTEWTIVFVGGEVGQQDLQDLFFQDQEVITQNLGRILLWKLPRQSKIWLTAGADLVICELSRLTPWKPSAAYSFSGPDWVMQIIDLPASPEELLSGRRIHGPRRRIRQAEKNGYEFRFTRSVDDYYLFYNEMYLPFVQARHGEQALFVPMKDQRDRWFKPGGLILVTKNDKPVAGSLVIQTGKMAFGIEMGVLNCDPELLEAGVIAFLQWGTILWSYKNGVKQLNLGGSKGYCANGSFDSKSKWGARVVKQKRITPLRHFLSDHLPDSLRERINQVKLISERNGKFYCTFITETDNEDLDKMAQDAVDHGLSGLAVVQSGPTRYLPD
jgi:hypothetical protein